MITAIEGPSLQATHGETVREKDGRTLKCILSPTCHLEIEKGTAEGESYHQPTSGIDSDIMSTI